MSISKRFLLAFITVSSIKPISINTHSNDDAFLFAAGAALVGIATSYGVYKMCESSSYKNAHQRVANAENSLRDYQQSYADRLDKQQLFAEYNRNLRAYDDLKDTVSQDIGVLEDIESTLQSVKSSWATTDYAENLVQNARELLTKNNSILTRAREQHDLIKRIRPLIALEDMLSREQNTALFNLIQARDQYNFESVITALYAVSKWPFLQAFNDLNQRKQQYNDNVNAYTLKDFTTTREQARKVIALYAYTQERIVANPRYTQDQRYKQEYENEQEKLRLERERLKAAQRQAEAAQQQAYAAQQQADAARQQAYATQLQAQAIAQQNVQLLKNRLLELRIALNNTAFHIEQARMAWDYERARQLEHNHNLLRQEAIKIRTQLYGHPDIIQLFVDVFNATEYI